MSDSEIIDEELKIGEEQDSEGRTLSSSSFTRPIMQIKMPRVVAMDESSKLGEVIGLMQERKFGSVVLTNDGVLSGIFTERDVLMKVIGKIDNWKDVSVSEVMTPNPQSLMKEDEVAYVLNNMHIGGYRHVPIVNEKDEPISMLSIKDVVSWVLDHFPQDITNMTGEPYRGERQREGA